MPRQTFRLIMKYFTMIFPFAAVFAAAVDQNAQIVGRGRDLKEVGDETSVAIMKQLAEGARNLEITHGRHLSSPLDKTEVLIKNVDCSACMEAPPALARKLRAGKTDRRLGPKDVFVTALNCDTTDPFQIWNLLSLEPTGTWYLFESVETGECMQVVGVCNPDGTLYDVEMGPCDETNFKAFWAFTGVGEIVNFECFRSNWEAETFFHSTPDIFLEAKCSNRGGKEFLGLSSHSADSRDQAEVAWVLYPKTFGDIAPP